MLLRKEGRQQTPIEVDYSGFDIPDAFVVGYGLDAAERYRNLPFVAVYRGQPDQMGSGATVATS